MKPKTIEEEFPPQEDFGPWAHLHKIYTRLRARAIELERDLTAQQAHADEIYDAAVNPAAKLEDDLEQARQDLKQADLDCLRALGERNDERKLADRLAGELQWWGDYCGDMEQPDPTKITRMLTELCDYAERLERELAAAKHAKKQAEEQRDATKKTRTEILRNLDAARENERKAQVQLILAQQMHEAERTLVDRLAAPLMFNEGEVESEQQPTFTPAHVAALTAWKEARK